MKDLSDLLLFLQEIIPTLSRLGKEYPHTLWRRFSKPIVVKQVFPTSIDDYCCVASCNKEEENTISKSRHTYREGMLATEVSLLNTVNQTDQKYRFMWQNRSI